MTKIIACLAAGLILAGLVVGFVPISSGLVSCGTAFVATDDAQVADLGSTLGGSTGLTDHTGDCASKRGLLRIPAIALLVLGVAAGVGAVVASPRPEQPE